MLKRTAIDPHIPWIRKAGQAGVQVLGHQALFHGPDFCPAQAPHWYDAAATAPGSITEEVGQLAALCSMAMAVPGFEMAQAGDHYSTAAVTDADGRYLGKYRKSHIPHTHGFCDDPISSPAISAIPPFRPGTPELGCTFATIGIPPKAPGRWGSPAPSVPVWAKLTPNVTDIAVPARAAVAVGAQGI
jgi:beta-ureidopropionase